MQRTGQGTTDTHLMPERCFFDPDPGPIRGCDHDRMISGSGLIAATILMSMLIAQSRALFAAAGEDTNRTRIPCPGSAALDPHNLRHLAHMRDTPSPVVMSRMNLPRPFAFSPVSIGVGSNGPTRQPVELLTRLRTMPGVLVFRPANTGSRAEIWQIKSEDLPPRPHRGKRPPHSTR